jgi:hypothetical protein
MGVRRSPATRVLPPAAGLRPRACSSLRSRQCSSSKSLFSCWRVRSKPPGRMSSTICPSSPWLNQTPSWLGYDRGVNSSDGNAPHESRH